MHRWRGKLSSRSRRWVAAVGLSLSAALAVAVLPIATQSAQAVTAFGPTAAFGPNSTVIPTWYSDGTGLHLQPCFAGPPRCFNTAADFTPASRLGEAFYFNSTATLSTTPPAGVAQSASVIVMALEGAFAPSPGPNVFQRIRVRVQVPQTGTYTVTYPYGVKTFNVTTLGAGFQINNTVDTGCFATATVPCNFAAAEGTGPDMIEPFLQQAGPGAPAGFLSDGVTPTAVTGSPNGTNFVRIVGPGINPNPAAAATACPAGTTVNAADCIQQSLFVLQGELAPGLNANPTNLTFGPQAAGSTSASRAVTVTNSSASPITITPTITTTGTNPADFAIVPGNTCAGATLAAGGTCSVSVTFTPPAGTAAGSTRTAQLAIPSNDPTSPLNVALSGSTPPPPPPPPPAPPAPAPAGGGGGGGAAPPPAAGGGGGASTSASGGSSSQAATLKPVTRIAGDDRVATAIAASKDAYPTDGSASAVVLANSTGFADALAGTALAAAKQGPLLLNPADGLDSRVAAEIGRVAPAGATVYVLGGEAALRPEVVGALQHNGNTVVRYGGANRYQTAVQIADAGLGNPSTVFEATGTAFADAVTAGAAAAHLGGAVLLTNGSSQAPETATYLASHAGVTRYALGGAAAAADPTANTIVGADRYETAVMVARALFTDPATIGLASGSSFADALAGGSDIATRTGPMLLAPSSGALPASLQSYLQSNNVTIGSGWVYGGVAAVSNDVVNSIQHAIS